MPALPTLTQVKQWDVHHLTDAAAHWSRTADLWESTFHDVWRATVRPGGAHWDGRAADTAQDMTWRDLVRVRGCAEALRLAARIAKIGAESLFDVKRLTLEAVDQAHADAMIVGEDLSVTGPGRHAGTTAADHAEDIRHLAANLVALDRDIALRLHSTALGIGEGIPYLAQGCS